MSIDKQTASQARVAAGAMGKSLNQAILDNLEHLAGMERLEWELQAFNAAALASTGRLNGWTWDRDEANRRG
ncbi:MAG: MerR family transcriptional regulator [Burkholderiales bacterium]